MPVGRVFLLAFVLAALFAAPGQARAAIPLSPCKTGGVQCGTLVVPLDRSGATPGPMSLHVEVLPAQGFVRGVMFLIAGGPGQGSAGAFDLGSEFNRDLMRFMFPNYTLVAFDNRGTGKSGLIDCPGLQTGGFTTTEQDAALAAQCAAIIGPNRVFYATRDHAEDVDSVRAALGVDRIGLFGVSYGTKLALAYALAHPDHVERLALDSVVPPNFPDPFDRNVFSEMPGTLSAFCAGICRSATPNYAAEVVRLANRIAAKPMQGKIVAANGKLKTVRINGENLISMLVDTDLSPGLAAETPAAVHAAVAGNIRPLLRIFDLDRQASKLAAEDLSFGLYAATNCADGRFPWSPGTAPAARRSAIDAFLVTLPPATFGGFGSWAARTGTAFFCEQWPAPSGNTPLGPGPYPNVPMIAIGGGIDLRTPIANARAILGSFPQGRLVTVPGVGHSVTSPTSDTSGCSQRAVRAWILGTLAQTTLNCPRVQPLVKVIGAFPRRPGSRRAAATLAVVGKTIREAQATWWQLLFSSKPVPVGGLYGGKLANAKAGFGFRLTRYSVAPGVSVSGKISFADVGPPTTYTGTVRVSGAAALAGTLKVSKSGRLTGTLGGHQISGRY